MFPASSLLHLKHSSLCILAGLVLKALWTQFQFACGKVFRKVLHQMCSYQFSAKVLSLLECLSCTAQQFYFASFKGALTNTSCN